MLYDIRHRTTFEYEDTVSIANHMLHLKPRNAVQQQRLSFGLNFDPEPSQCTERYDYFGNHAHYLTLQQPHQRFVVESLSPVDVNSPPPPVLDATAAW